MNALQSPIFIQSSWKFFWTPSDGLSCLNSKISLFAYPRWQPLANLHILDRRQRSPVGNIRPICTKFILNTLWWIILLKFENQLICIYPRWPPWANLHILDQRERSPVVNVHPFCPKFFWTPSDWLSCSSLKISKFAYSRWPPRANLHI